ncbi:MAG: helix-turn-helix transcriptional regulator [Syntrophaceticus sp.]
MQNIVEKLRKDRGLNQEELSKVLKVSRQTISAIENGKYNPSLDLAFTISEFFGLKIEEIFFPNRGGERNEEK